MSKEKESQSNDVNRVLTITTPDIENGLGNRVTIWFAGCSHHCPGCHNQHTWNYNQGQLLMSEHVLEKIYAEVKNEYIEGITLSGGDPLSRTDKQLDELTEFLVEFRKRFPKKNVWIYAGDTFEEAICNQHKENVLKQCDVMVDGEFKIDLKDQDLAFRGSSNQRIINLKKSLSTKKVSVMKIK